jgi:hypothetical protein
VKAIPIPINGPPREVDLPGGGGTRFMRSLRALIGTQCAERIRVTSRWEAALDEDGAAAGKPVNQAATLVASSFGFEFCFVGPVVITGLDKDASEPASLSRAQADAIREKGHQRPDVGLVRRRCSLGARVSMSRASLREAAQAASGARAAGLRKV